MDWRAILSVGRFATVGVTAAERAALGVSHGRLSTAPNISGLYRKIRGMIGRGFKYILGG